MIARMDKQTQKLLLQTSIDTNKKFVQDVYPGAVRYGNIIFANPNKALVSVFDRSVFIVPEHLKNTDNYDILLDYQLWSAASDKVHLELIQTLEN